MNQDTNTEEKKIDTEVHTADVQKEEVHQSEEIVKTEEVTPGPVKAE